jgi:hypothetical protein
MKDTTKYTNLINALRSLQDQLRMAVRDRDHAWLALATIATAKRLDAADLRRMAVQASPSDPWDVRIDLELKRAAQQRTAQQESEAEAAVDFEL